MSSRDWSAAWITTPARCSNGSPDDLGAQGTVCAGGRYDGLVAQLGGAATPGIGWAMGQERIVMLHREAGQRDGARRPQVYLVLVGEPAEVLGFKVAEQLRDVQPRLRLQINLGGGNFKTQFKRADKSGAEYAIVLGEDEAARGVAALKALRRESAQEECAIGALGERLGALLGLNGGGGVDMAEEYFDRRRAGRGRQALDRRERAVGARRHRHRRRAAVWMALLRELPQRTRAEGSRAVRRHDGGARPGRPGGCEAHRRWADPGLFEHTVRRPGRTRARAPVGGGERPRRRRGAVDRGDERLERRGAAQHRALAPGARADRPGQGGCGAQRAGRRQGRGVRRALSRGARRCAVCQEGFGRRIDRIQIRAGRQRSAWCRRRPAAAEDRRHRRARGPGARRDRQGHTLMRHTPMRHTLKRPLLAALAVLAFAAGCDKDKDVEPPAVLVNFPAKLPVREIWSANLGGGKKQMLLRLGLGPAIDNGVAYAASHKGEVLAVALESGKHLWVKNLKLPLSAGPAAADGLLVVGSSKGAVIALDAASGRQLWRTQVNAELLAAPAIGE